MEVLGGRLAFVADNDPGASAILAHRFPGVPNLGDLTAVDWSSVPPVDALVGGPPCQDISAAGKRAGLQRGNRSGVWHEMVRAIAILRPSLVVIENVRGLLTARGDLPTDAHLRAEAARDCASHLLGWLENEADIAHAKGDRDRARRVAARTARVMGYRKRAVARCQWHEQRLVRAIGTVLGSLADLSYDAVGAVVSAADAGAPHRRERVFIIGWPAADPGGERWDRRAGGGRDGRAAAIGQQAGCHGSDSGSAPAADTAGVGRGEGRPEHAGLVGGPNAALGGAAPANPARVGYGHARPAGERGVPVATERGPASHPDGAARYQRRVAAPGQAQGRGARADAGRRGGTPPANPSGAGLEVRPVEPDGQERPAAERGSRNGDAPADPDRGGLPELEECDSGTLAGLVGALGDDPVGCGQAPADPAGVGRGLGGRRERPGGAGKQLGLRPAECQPGDIEWGPYGPAIARWEAVLGRAAPPPTEPGRTGARLSPRFVEWLQGLPEGWVTGVPGLSRNDQLKALGNGVVPQQCVLALRLLLELADERAA